MISGHVELIVHQFPLELEVVFNCIPCFCFISKEDGSIQKRKVPDF